MRVRFAPPPPRLPPLPLSQCVHISGTCWARRVRYWVQRAGEQCEHIGGKTDVLHSFTAFCCTSFIKATRLAIVFGWAGGDTRSVSNFLTNLVLYCDHPARPPNTNTSTTTQHDHSARSPSTTNQRSLVRSFVRPIVRSLVRSIVGSIVRSIVRSIV